MPIYGIPGSNIYKAAKTAPLSKQGNLLKGAAGEYQFYSILKYHGILEKYDSFWSLKVPEAQAEVDVILTNLLGHILLVDVKLWDFKRFKYVQTEPYKVIRTRYEDGQETVFTLGHSLYSAQQYFKDKYQAPLTGTMTVFLGADKEEVCDIKWPGAVMTTNLSGAIKAINETFPNNEVLGHKQGVIAHDHKQFTSTAYLTKYLDEKVEYLRDGFYQRLII